MKLLVPVDSLFMIDCSIAIIVFLTLKDHESAFHHVKVILSFLGLGGCLSWILVDRLVVCDINGR